MERKAFLDQEPPPGYIAGIGRGATGFTTRSDIGNARLPPQTRLLGDEDNEDGEGRFADADGDEGGLLSSVAAGNKEDEEADEIYKEIEERLKQRNKRKKAAIDDDDENNGIQISNLQKISNQFVDLKKDLSTITDEQWANLPEVGDLTRRNKRMRILEQKEQKTYAAPDSLLSGISGGNNNDHRSVNISALNSERHKLLGSKIDASLSLNDEDTIDTNSYLNEISSLNPSVREEDTAKLKTILNSFTKADPKNPEGWIARARIEELDKKFSSAKKLISQGCANCPKNEEIWIENVRLNRYDLKAAKVIITEAIKFNNQSVKLWLKAVELENEIFNKKRVIRKAIENIPTSVELWLESIKYEENEQDKLKIVTKAIEIIPKNETLWLNLIRLLEYNEAKKTLNKARKELDNNVLIWLEACKLEAVKNGQDVVKLGKLVKKMMKDVELTDEAWYAYAIEFEKDVKLTILSELIVETLLSNHAEDELSYVRLSQEADKYKANIYIYKTILNFIVMKFPKKIIIWRKLIQVYIDNFPKEVLYQMFEKIISTIPKTAMFWLMYSKQVWKSDNDIPRAKGILEKSLTVLPNNVDIWLAMIKLETIQKDFTKVDELFHTALSKIENERLHHKYVTYLRVSSTPENALLEVDKSLKKFPNCYKLHLQKAQILSTLARFVEARESLSIATKQIPDEILLWEALSLTDVKLGNQTRARSDLDVAISQNPKSDELWLYKLQLERQLNNTKQLPIIITTALQKFPNSALLWDFNLRYIVTKSQRKTAYQDALAATGNNERILLAIGVNFWKDGKISKTKKWFERAIETENDFGDAWGWMYNCLMKEINLDNYEEITKFIEKFNEVEPRHGDVYPKVAKALSNLDKEPVEILKLVAVELVLLNVM